MSKYFQASRPESISPVNLGEAYAPLVVGDASPIDAYYSRVEGLVVRAQAAQIAGENDLIPLLFLRLISATESYVRDLLSRLPAVCPIVWAHCSDHSIPLGAAYHYERPTLAIATLEHVSFSTKGEIQKQTLKIANVHVASDSSLRAALEAFESISELRHSVVHSYDELFYRNLKELKVLNSSTERFAVSISPLLFQSFVAVCHSFVRAYNRFLLDKLLDGWVNNAVLTFDWGRDKGRFELAFHAFKSSRDGTGPSNAYRAFQQVVKTISTSTASAGA